jgi:MoxR-like ATPase
MKKEEYHKPAKQSLGRPSKKVYKDKVRSDRYYLAKNASKYTKKVPSKTKTYLRECIKQGKTPFLEELALRFGVSDRTLYNWAYPKDGSENEFTKLYELLKTIQKLDIKKKALIGTYENPIAKIILSAEHNLVERVRKEVTGADGEPMRVESSLSPEQRKRWSEEVTKLVEKMQS